MSDLLLVLIAGFLAAGVDGALGMGFGPTSATLLLASGVSPASTSITVNVAKLATGVVGGAAHWRLGNVDRRLVATLAVPGVGGAVVGATVLGNVDGDRLRPVLAALLVLVGLRMLWRFSTGVPATTRADGRAGKRVAAAGLAGGATNALVGAWGPVVTPFLVQRGVEPRLAVGSVNTAEVPVAAASAGALLAALGTGGLDPLVTGTMLLGGVVAAPLAAAVVGRVPARPLGLAVAALLLTTQGLQLASSGVVPVPPTLVPVVAAALTLAAASRPRFSVRRPNDRHVAADPRTEASPAGNHEP